MIYLGLNEAIPNWVSRIRKERQRRTPIRTTDGHIVVPINEFKYAVQSRNDSKRFIDLATKCHAWSRNSQFFKDCLATREEIEKEYGKFIYPEVVDTH